MSRERQYTILSQDGSGCGSVWAHEIQKRSNPSDGFWLLRSGNAIASAWFGYIDHANGKKVLPRASQSANAEEPATVGIADGSAKA